MLDTDDHFRLIEKAVLSGAERPDAVWRTQSWSRCLQEYKLDPSRPEMIDLSSRELRLEREHFDSDISIATAELESTLMMIEGGGYSAHIANRNGVIISERRSRDSTFYCSGDRTGAVWSEEVGGTNGIGTALRSLMPTAVYLTDHFYAELTGQACAASPFFGPDGNVLGVVNLSTRNPGLPQLAHRVIFGVAQITADRLETTYFRTFFRKFYTLTLNVEQKTPAIFALDSDFRIVGATRSARLLFKLEDSAIGSRSLWGIFEKIRGNPTIDYFCENLRELRQLGSSKIIDVVMKRPISVAAVTETSLVKAPTKAKAVRKITTLVECAGADPQMKRNIDILRRIFGCGLHVLLLGETGVGKDTLARALHYESERAAGPFVAFNCSAVPETLIDSELFGYSGGAFTGASKEGNAGRIVEADKGTLFLDEIGDMPLQLQTRLLRFLETQEVMPLGSGKVRTVDVQVVAATHQNLHEKVAAGTFREDLFYRLAGTIVTIPALRNRKDLETIIENILEQISDAAGVTIDENAMAELVGHSWPGNIRELKNVLTRAVRLTADGIVRADDLMLPAPAQDRVNQVSFPPVPAARPASPTHTASATSRNAAASPSRLAANNAERDAILVAIQNHGSDAIACANALGISRATLYRKLKQHSLSFH